MRASTSLAAVDASRQLILQELGDAPDLTLVSGGGDRGDELFWAGARELLADRIYREVELAGLCSASGHTVLLSGSGGFCRAARKIMLRALAVAEIRFERVIVLPSSVDPSDDAVREALMRTRATVFAREPESYRRIVSLCDARLAHDCAFFFDFSPYRCEGRGTLNAFAGDGEASPGRSLPVDNDDVSLTPSSFEVWLRTIADHELVCTDQDNVTIAAALLGKRVQLGSSLGHGMAALVEYALSDYPVAAAAPPTPPAPPTPRGRPLATNGSSTRGALPPRVTAIILAQDRPEQALRAIDSLRQSSVSLRTLVIDNNSPPAAAGALADGCAARQGVLLRRSDRNLGCAGGRRLALEAVDSELVLFVDDDVELAPGALDLLVAELDAHPETTAVTATVLMTDGTVHHSGGWLALCDGVAEFSLIGCGQPLEDALPPSGPAGWAPGTAQLVRRGVLEDFPIDEQMSTYYEDNEWCYRVELARPGSFRRSLEARALHHFTPKHWPGEDFATRSQAMELLDAHARFYQLHGVLLGVELFELVPELRDADGSRDLVAARLLMELLLAKGTAWTFMEWMNGSLDGLLSASRRLAAQRAASDRLELKLAEQARTIGEQVELLSFLSQRHAKLQRIEEGGWWRLRQRLLPALRLLWRLRAREQR